MKTLIDMDKVLVPGGHLEYLKLLKGPMGASFRKYRVSFLSTNCELSNGTCSENVYSHGPRSGSRPGSRCVMTEPCTGIIVLV